MLPCSNTARLQHKCTFQSRCPKLLLWSGYFNDSFHFFSLLRQAVEEVLWPREQCFAPRARCCRWAPWTPGGEQSPAGAAAGPAGVGTAPPHRCRPPCYLQPHKLLLPFQAVVHGLGDDEPHGALQRTTHGTGMRASRARMRRSHPREEPAPNPAPLWKPPHEI